LFQNKNTDYRQDRFEITYNNEIYPIYGLGRVSHTDQVELSDFVDTSFGFGNVHPNNQDWFNADIGRMRTPIFILPNINTIIVYLQPYPSVVRLTRADNKTEIIMKNNSDYSNSLQGELLIIKKDSIEEAYKEYYKLLKVYQGLEAQLFFKKPHYKAFGLYWETYDQFGCSATLTGITGVLNGYKNAGIFPSVITIGSGYWGSNDLSGCDNTAYEQTTTTDTFSLSPTRIGSLNNFNNQIEEWKNQGAYLTIGMRHIFYPKQSNLERSQGLFNQKGFTGDVFLNEQIYRGNRPSDNVRLLNLKSDDAIGVYLQILRSAYGNIMGIKEDDMIWADQVRVAGSGSKNFNPLLLQNAFRVYSTVNKNDFINFGSNNLFGVATDGQYTPGIIHNNGFSSQRVFGIKPLLDVMLSQVYSGYPHPIMESWTYPCGSNWNISGEKDTYRTYQLATFLPITQHSCDYHKLNNINYINALDFYSKLRMRLQKYAYDKAQDWYYSGVPTLMRPLNLFDEWKEDKNVQALYQRPTVPTSEMPKNEFMFGNALLVRPILDPTDQITVYLPKGEWIGFLNKTEKLIGPSRYPMDLSNNYLNYSVFLKEGEILVIGKQNDYTNYQVYAYMNSSNQSSVYSFYKIENDPSIQEDKIDLQVIKVSDKYKLKNLNNGKSTDMILDSYGKGFQVANLKDVL